MQNMERAQKSLKGASGKAAPKGKKAQGGGKKVEDDREETLQAVVRNNFHAAEESTQNCQRLIL